MKLRSFLRPLSLACYAAAALLATAPLHAQVSQIPRLNDTGHLACYNAFGEAPCDSVARDSGTHPRQDGRYGRDRRPDLPKTGAGAKGFDYTRLCNSGDAAGTNTCPATPVLGSGADEWSCTRDNVTGLVWEVKTAGAAGLRGAAHRYAWYSSGPYNGNNVGSTGTDTCAGTLPGGLCNLETYTAAVNAAGLCGATDWRAPNRQELQSLLDYGNADPFTPGIDANFFPNTVGGPWWTNVTDAGLTGYARHVDFTTGGYGANLKAATASVRLVRGGN